MKSMQETRPLIRVGLLIAGAAFLFLVGSSYHLHLWSTDPSSTHFGDTGDGMFNFWILEHVLHTLPRGLGPLSDGGMFWPHHEMTYWWSDNLLVPAVLYAGLKAVTGNAISGYWWTTIVLSGFVFAMQCALFARLWLYAKDQWPLLSYRTLFWTPLFAVLAFFSQIRLFNYLHFQHLAGGFFICLILAACGYAIRRRGLDFRLVCLSEILLLYTAPYYAVLGLCVILWWLSFIWIDGNESPIVLLRRFPMMVGLTLALLAALAWQYAQTASDPYAPSVVGELSMEWQHLVTPLKGPIRDALQYTVPSVVAKRGGGYPGIGLLIGVILAGAALVGRYRSRIRAWGHNKWVFLFLFLFIVTLVDAKEIKWFTCYLRSALGLAALALGAIRLRRGELGPATRTAIFLAGAFVLVMGIAFGPSAHFRFETFDPSIWGVLSLVIPGFGNMRDVLRFAPLGLVLLLGLLLLFLLSTYSHSRRRNASISMMVLVLMGLQQWEALSMRARQSSLDPAAILLTEPEKEILADLEGPVLMIPATPFHANTLYMLRLAALRRPVLVNGYSSHSTPLFDHLMHLERRHGRASPEQIQYAQIAGVNVCCLEKCRIPGEALKRLRSKHPVVGESRRFLWVGL